MLEVNNVSVNIGDACLVKNVSFSLHEGEWLMLCGPNGAGKTTLLNAVSQGCKYNGSIKLNGMDMSGMKPREIARSVGFLMQHNYLSYAYSVEDIVALGRYSHKKSFLRGESDEDKSKIEYALDITGLTGIRSQNALTLSGGELQRAFMAQLICQEPNIMILDEPANHLDPVYQRQLFSLIRKWLNEPGRAVLSVVHDLSLARFFGTHAMLMKNGETLSYGTVDSALSRENLARAYDMDMYVWIEMLHGAWNDITE